MRIQRGLALVILAAAIVGGTAGAPGGATARPSASGGRLEPFANCGELVAYLREQAMAAVTPWGIAGTGSVTGSGAVSTPAVAARATAVQHSTTNVQEEGVDEPDLVKSDGTRLFVVRGNVLHALTADGGPPRRRGTLVLENVWPTGMFLHGNRVILVATGAAYVAGTPGPAVTVASSPTSPRAPSAPSSSTPGWTGGKVIEVDVTDPAAMRVVRTLSFDGHVVAARMRRGVARVVVASPVLPRVPFVQPTDHSPAAQQRAWEQNRELVASLPAAAWLPRREVRQGGDESGPRELLVECDQVLRGPDSTGFSLTSILTLDVGRGIEPVDADAALLSAGTAYVSRAGLYLAGSSWRDGAQTPIHRFDVSRRAETTYAASGAVEGALKDVWSLSEHAGSLRVVTTRATPWDSETFVTVLQLRDGELKPVGRVGNLGRGEDVYAVRFLGEIGYVVTFRRIDPLYTLDLSDPERPRLLGELKIPGYSAYLHPLGGDLLLGVGQEATLAGMRVGTQLSLFDTSDLRQPKRLHARMLGWGNSQAEWNHHAFTYWPAKRTVVVPFAGTTASTAKTRASAFSGAIAFRLGGGFAEIGRVTHGDAKAHVAVLRSLVVGETLYTVSDWGVKANDLDTFAPRGAVGLRLLYRPAR